MVYGVACHLPALLHDGDAHDDEDEPQEHQGVADVFPAHRQVDHAARHQQQEHRLRYNLAQQVPRAARL